MRHKHFTLARKFASVVLLSLFSTAAEAGITFTNIFHFNGTNGNSPHGTLVQGRDGNLYGVASGGPGNDGTVFRVSLHGVFTNLAWFGFTNGSSPRQGLVEALDGNFYGTTADGGVYGPAQFPAGTVFKITPQGLLNTVFSFDNTNGGTPLAGLVLASDGNLYGTTELGGDNPILEPFLSNLKSGTVFRISQQGEFAKLVSFNEALVGAGPEAPLIQAADGNLYGTTTLGGTFTNELGYSQGTVFRMSLDGTMSRIAMFDGTNGYANRFALVQAPDGSLYGTSRGGPLRSNVGGIGNFFKVGLDGSVTNLFSFSGYDGSNPGGLLRCADGNFYGLCGQGSAIFGGPDYFNNKGNIFRITPEGALTILMTFDGTNGGYCYGGLLQASDGNLYGLSQGGGQYGRGTIFRLSVPLPSTFTRISRMGDAVALTWTAVASQTYQVQCRTSPTFGDWTNLGGWITATNGTMTTFDEVGADTQRLYRVVLIP